MDDMASTLLADKFVLAGQELGFEHVDVTAQKQFGEIFNGSPDNITYSLTVKNSFSVEIQTMNIELIQTDGYEDICDH